MFIYDQKMRRLHLRNIFLGGAKFRIIGGFRYYFVTQRNQNHLIITVYGVFSHFLYKSVVKLVLFKSDRRRST